MASLNLSINGPSIRSSYQGVISGPALASGSPTSAQWALFSVQAPLLNAFQDSAAKESVLKVESTGDGDLSELVEDFSEGRIQFAFVKVKDPNTTLPKHVLIAWCGGGVPERTKGYFTSHLAAVSKVLHGYHVQITARSDNDLVPETIIQKVADASGAKYSSGGAASMPAPAPPPVKTKPVFTPTTSSAGSINPIVAARNRKDANLDNDGWGADAPPVTRTQLEKVESAYKPTKVNIAELTRQKEQPKFVGSAKPDDQPGDIVRGGYQPVGKVDIAAIRAQAATQQDDRPTIVKGAYEPIGKVDIAAIRAKAQRPVEEPSESKSLADRTAAFSQPNQAERLTSLPKPKVGNKFGGASSFTGTKAPTPVGFGTPTVPTAAPVGAASRTFADQGGKTPAQLWAEKKAARGESMGGGAGNTVSPPLASPLNAQKSGSEWKSGYTGKSWAPVQTPAYGRGDIGQQKTGDTDDRDLAEVTDSSAGAVSALRDRFKDAAPISSAPLVPRASGPSSAREPSPPPPDMSSRPSGGFALPGLPARPPPPTDEEEPEPSYDEPEPSPIRVAMPVSRNLPTMEAPEERSPPQPIPAREIEKELPKEEYMEPEEDAHAAARGAATAVAAQTFGTNQAAAAQAPQADGKRALIQYDYEKAEGNEIELKEGEYVTNIQMVDDDWWMGTNSQGESGLFPSNYVELVDDEPAAPTPVAAAAASRPAAPVPEPEPVPESAAVETATATALFDYEAAEDNELSFAEGAKITNLEFPDEDWWFGHYRGKSGLFPANYVQLDS